MAFPDRESEELDEEERILERFNASDRAEFERRATQRQYPAGADLFREGDPSEWVIALLSGRVKLTCASPDGRDIVLAIRAGGAVLGELAAVDGGLRSATATALEPVEALLVPASSFREFLAGSPSAALLLFQVLACRVRVAGQRDLEHASLDTSSRVAARLYELALRFGTPDEDGVVAIELSITQDELAGWAGCSVEATGRALSLLRRRGLVRTARRRITILDMDALGAQASS